MKISDMKSMEIEKAIPLFMKEWRKENGEYPDLDWMLDAMFSSGFNRIQITTAIKVLHEIRNCTSRYGRSFTIDEKITAFLG